MCSFTYILYINCRRPEDHRYETWERISCDQAVMAGIECIRTIADYYASEPQECEECEIERLTGRRCMPPEFGVFEAMPNMGDLMVDAEPEERFTLITEPTIRYWAHAFNMMREEQAGFSLRRRVGLMQSLFLEYCWSQYVRRDRNA